MCAARVFLQCQRWDYRGDQGDKEGARATIFESKMGLGMGGMARAGAVAASAAFCATVDVFLAVSRVP